MMYRFFLTSLLLLPAEFSHRLTLLLLRWLFPTARAKRLAYKCPTHPINVAGLRLANPIGLAAGLDKDARCIDAWFAMGFGFVEVGTVTPKPQIGNPKPRLFRLKTCRALINRMGFNNNGIDALVNRLKQRRLLGVVGVNIGKNQETPLEKANEDYCLCLEKIYPYADYVALNISSPNTPGLRELQGRQYLDDLLKTIMQLRNTLKQQYQRHVPLWVKIAPDLEESELMGMLTLFLKHQIDGVIATNTSLGRDTVSTHPHAKECGGLSGDPLYARAKSIVNLCLQQLKGRIPVIAVGGINSPGRVCELLDLGATAVQIYSAFIYQGPALIKQIINKLNNKSKHIH